MGRVIGHCTIVAHLAGATPGVPVSQSASVATTDLPLALSLPVAAPASDVARVVQSGQTKYRITRRAWPRGVTSLKPAARNVAGEPI